MFWVFVGLVLGLAIAYVAQQLGVCPDPPGRVTVHVTRQPTEDEIAAQKQRERDDLMKSLNHHAAIEADIALSMLRDRVHIVCQAEGISTGSGANHYAAQTDRPTIQKQRRRRLQVDTVREECILPVVPRSPKLMINKVIDPNTRFFRVGEYTSDSDGRITSGDANFERIVGMSLQEMQVSGRGWSAKVHADDFPRIMRILMTAAQLPVARVVKLRYVHPYTQAHTLSITNPIFKHNTLVGMAGYLWLVDKATYEMIKLESDTIGSGI